MKSLNETRSQVRNAVDKLELYAVVDEYCDSHRYSFNESMSYKQNAKIAELSLKFGVSEILLEAHRKELAL